MQWAATRSRASSVSANYGINAAERAGFEPAVAHHHTAFRERHLQPLGHLSGGRVYGGVGAVPEARVDIGGIRFYDTGMERIAKCPACGLDHDPFTPCIAAMTLESELRVARLQAAVDQAEDRAIELFRRRGRFWRR